MRKTEKRTRAGQARFRHNNDGTGSRPRKNTKGAGRKRYHGEANRRGGVARARPGSADAACGAGLSVEDDPPDRALRPGRPGRHARARDRAWHERDAQADHRHREQGRRGRRRRRRRRRQGRPRRLHHRAERAGRARLGAVHDDRALQRRARHRADRPHRHRERGDRRRARRPGSSRSPISSPMPRRGRAR